MFYAVENDPQEREETLMVMEREKRLAGTVSMDRQGGWHPVPKGKRREGRAHGNRGWKMVEVVLGIVEMIFW